MIAFFNWDFYGFVLPAIWEDFLGWAKLGWMDAYEGCSRNSELEYKRFIEIAIGSAFELETQLIICCELNYIQKAEIQELQEELITLQKQTNTLISLIANSQKLTAYLNA